MKHSRKLSHLQQLAAHWHKMAEAVMAFARQISMAKKMRSRSGPQRAEMLEAFIYAALVQLVAVIAAETAKGKPATRAEKHALEHLKAIYLTLCMVARLVTHMRLEMQAAADAMDALNGAPTPMVVIAAEALAYPPTYLDSS